MAVLSINAYLQCRDTHIIANSFVCILACMYINFQREIGLFSIHNSQLLCLLFVRPAIQNHNLSLTVVFLFHNFTVPLRTQKTIPD